MSGEQYWLGAYVSRLRRVVMTENREIIVRRRVVRVLAFKESLPELE
jgi:hypothetical protein